RELRGRRQARAAVAGEARAAVRVLRAGRRIGALADLRLAHEREVALRRRGARGAGPAEALAARADVPRGAVGGEDARPARRRLAGAAHAGETARALVRRRARARRRAPAGPVV